MYCTNCGKHNPESSEFCKYCGTKFNVKKTSSESSTPYTYVISIPKLIILSTVTFGLYDIYWFYKQWKSFKKERDLKVTPWARALFATLMSYSLFKEVAKAVKSVDKTRNGLEAGGLAIAYFILVILYRLPEPYWLLSLLSVLPLIPVQKAINFYWLEKYEGKIVKSGFGVWNWIWTIIGGIILLIALYGTFNTNSSTTSTTNSKQTPQVQTSGTVNNSQAVIDITCNNDEGGSGTIFSKDGVVLTNNHVIVGASSCLITLPDTTTGQPKAIYTAKPIIVPNLSKQYDLAFLQINNAYTDSDGKTWGKYPTNFPAFTPPNDCKNYTPHLGDYVRIYGYPVTSGGYNLTITDGIISSFADDNDILTSAKIDSGNSGGLAVSKDGCFLGVPSAVVSGNYQNLGVIIPWSVIDSFANGISSPKPVSGNSTGSTSEFDSSCLSLNNDHMQKSSSSTTNPEYEASLYNGCSQAVKNVQIEVDFYAPDANSNAAPLDTEYVDSGATYLGAGNTFNVDRYINTPIDTSVNFNWTAEIYSADPF